MIPRSFVRAIIAVLTLSAMLCQGTLVLAGTTGGLTGTATDATTNAPLANAKVSAVSPSQIANTTTDAGGHFAFLSLAPDTYTVSVQSPGYETTATSGVTVIADNTRTLNLPIAKELRTVAVVRTRSVGSLVKPGTTADVYSVDPTQQSKFAAAGGGGTLNSAFSALSTVPGVYVASGQSGYIGAAADLSIRGGDYDQIGYEIDGVPVNRSFDNYPSGPASSLGQQELQVYTGGGPAGAEAQGLSGFINQVIRTGTSPGFATADLGVGGPAFYHKASFEFGGATPDRNFSYYVGIGGYDQVLRINDQFNGRGTGQLWGAPLYPCSSAVTPAQAPSCYAPGNVLYGTGTNAYNLDFGTAGAYVLGSNNLYSQSQVDDRDNVVNLHFGIPRKNGLKDDVQILGMVNYIRSYFYDSPNDLGGDAFLNAIGLGAPTYYDGYQFKGATGTFLPANYQGLTSVSYYPSSDTDRAPGALIPANSQDVDQNNQAILKLQYTHPFSQSSLLKVYGYTYYSNWLLNGPTTAYSDILGANAVDYELSSHTRGVSGSFIDQINAQNLLQLQGSFTTATALRDNNTAPFNAYAPRSTFAYVVDSSNPTNGLCYPVTGGAAVSCNDSTAGIATLPQAASGTIQAASGTCGGGPCKYLVTNNGQYATVNTVKPLFYAGSLTDNFHPTSKLAINAGLRMDIYQFQGGSTESTPARTFFYNAFNLDNCIASGNLVAREPGAACPLGSTPANITNPSGIVTESYTRFQPRLGATYSLDPATVLRASFGRYTQAPNSSEEQYDTAQPNAPAVLYSTYNFQKFGFTSPDHDVRPPTSNNYDFSVEHQFPGQVQVKISPFYRTTQDQIQNFFLNQQTGFVSGLNVGRQTSRGIEFELDKGDFARNGLAAKVSFTYTNSYIKYNDLSTGATILDGINSDISNYNAYTSACAPGGKDVGKTQYGHAICGTTTTGAAASACYSTYTPAVAATGVAQVNGVPEPCSAPDAVANPYYTAPTQNLVDPNASYPTFDIFPGGVGTEYNGYGAPYQGSIILNYKKGPFAVTPVFQMSGGQRYGAPESTYGVSPDQCSPLAGSNSASGDPRYPYGSQGGAGFDATNCNVAGLSIPNPYTKTYDGIGAFVSPGIMQLHLQLSYDVSKNVTLVANAANLYQACFGGTKAPWNVSGACNYTGSAGGATGDIGNQYNPGAAIQPYLNTPYLPTFAQNPFSLYVNANVKL